MEIIAFSDSHGIYSPLKEIYLSHPNAECFIHLGDGCEQVRQLRSEFPLIPLLAVRGNCDFGTNDSDCKFADIGGKHIMYTHGHRFDVKMGMAALKYEARKQNADIVLFGHTHHPFYEEIEGVHYVNPGSVAFGRLLNYAVIEISDNGEVKVSLIEK